MEPVSSPQLIPAATDGNIDAQLKRKCDWFFEDAID
jgi:hypothetical protein